MSRNRRELPEINAGSMADIAFLLLIFFLVTTTMDVDSGISRKLPPMPEENVEIPEIHERNIFVVLINKNNKILAGIGRPTNTIEINGDGSISSSLKEDVKTFITNNGGNTESSDSPDKAIVSLQNQEGTAYKTYIQVQNELTKAYNELRNEKSNVDYGKDFNRLNNEEQKKIKDFYPMKVSEAETKAN
jgi:biopolymer transport protein ExbD